MKNKSVYYRRDGRWECRVSFGKDENGRRKYRSFYGKTREEAEFHARFALENEEDHALTEMTVRELILEWLFVTSTRIKESTMANYRMKAEKHLIPTFGDMLCCTLRARDVHAFIKNKLQSGLSPRYVTDIVVLLKSVFRYGNREYHIHNVIDGIIMPRKIKPDIRILSGAEQKKLEKFIFENQDLTALGISFSIYMGLRIGEICALKWSDIDFEKRVLSVSHTVQRIQSKNGSKKTKIILSEPKSISSRREIPIPEHMLEIMRTFQKSDSVYVLSNSLKPMEPRVMQYRFAKLLKNAGLPSVHFHSLRHLFATNCIALGFDVKTLSELLGHSSVEVTLNRYVHSSMERKRVCMNLIKITA